MTLTFLLDGHKDIHEYGDRRSPDFMSSLGTFIGVQVINKGTSQLKTIFICNSIARKILSTIKNVTRT